MKRMSVRLAISLALVALLLIGAAYAAATRWDMQQFFTGLFGVELNEGAETLLGKKQVYGTLEIGELTVTVNEAIADGRCLYLGVVFAPKPGADDLLLLGTDASPEDRYDRFGTNENTQTYAELAKEKGKRMVHTNFSWSAGDRSAEVLDYMNNEDGTLSYVISGALPADADSVTVECLALTMDYDASGEMIRESQKRETFTIEAPVSAPLATARSTDTAAFENLGIQIDAVEMVRTALTTYSTIAYSVLDSATEAQKWHAHDGLWLRFVDEAGEPIRVGASMSGTVESPDDIHYTCTESLTLSGLPDTVRLEAYDAMEKTRFGIVILSMQTE